MATNILMPALSPTMTDGTLARWLKKEGDRIVAGDVIAEIETDKATMEVEAVDEGVLGKILVPDGTAGVKVNQPIAILMEDGGGGSAPEAPIAPPPPPVAQQTVSGSQTKSAPPNGHAPDGERIFASPLARRMAKQAGIDLHGIAGTGPNGRIVRADIETVHRPAGAPPVPLQAVPMQAAPEPVRAPSAVITAPHQKIPLAAVKRITARRLTQAKQTIPHFYVSIDVELDTLLQLRHDLNARSPKEGPGSFKLSVNDLFIKAAAATLRRVPNVNASFTEDAIILYDEVDISVAVSIPGGLITPIVRQADRKGLASISNETKSLIERARAGKLKPDEFQGGTFSISNMGMYGVRDFAAIINPPQAAILAIAAAEKRPVVKANEIVIATVMTATLSVDHRVVDGALAAEFLSAFKTIVEDPLSLML